MMIDQKIFKAYDIRGVYPNEINENISCVIIASLLKNKKIKRVSLAHDARLSSPKLYKKILSIIKNNSKKLEIFPIGISTTPMFYFLSNYLKADLGIMITASHNPKEYNGLKIVGKHAAPISGLEIYQKIKNV